MSLVSREYNIYHACTMRMSYWRTPAHNIGRSHAKIMRHEIGCCLIFSGISENSGDFRIASVKIVHVLFFVLRKRGFKLSSAFHWLRDWHAVICHTFPALFVLVFPALFAGFIFGALAGCHIFPRSTLIGTWSLFSRAYDVLWCGVARSLTI